MVFNIKSITSVEYNLEDASPSKPISVKYTQAELDKMENEEITNPKRPYSLGFISESITPTQKLDDKLQTKIQEFSAPNYKGKNHTYGFIMISGRVTPEKLQSITNYGVNLLGYHSGHSYKAKIPLDKVNEIKDLSFVKWIGYSTLRQKLHPNLFDKINIIDNEIFINNTHNNKEILVYISLFDNDKPKNSTKILKNKQSTYDKDIYIYNELGEFGKILEQKGVKINSYHENLFYYTGYVLPEVIEDLLPLDFVLHIEKQIPPTPTHDQSMSSISADYLRSTYDGSGISVGIIDTGYEKDHQDLPDASYCVDYVGSDCYEDYLGHGTHVAGTLWGRGNENSKYKGVATGITDIQIAKVSDQLGNFEDDAVDAINWMASSPAAEIVSMSMGVEETNCNGTDILSREVDDHVYSDKQIYVISAGNEDGSSKIRYPGCAKNAITVGAVLDYGEGSVDYIWPDSSRGSTGDDRQKPDIVAPGSFITSARWNTSLPCMDGCTCTGEYMKCSGTSMAVPHVSGLVATLLEHYSGWKENASIVKAVLAATSLIYEGDISNVGNTYGHGKVDSYLSHYVDDNPNGWTWGWISGQVDNDTWQYSDIEVPGDADRLIVILTWTEPAASAGADYAVINDLELYLDKGADEPGCTDGENASVLAHDNKEFIYLDNPGEDTFRIKVCPVIINNTVSPQKYNVAYMIIRGDPTPTTTVTTSANTSSVNINEEFTVTATVEPDSYVASGVYSKIEVPSGINIISMSTTREDGVTMTYISDNDDINLGNIHEGDTRSVTWTLKATTNGTKSINTSINSNNGGTDSDIVAITVSPLPDGYSCSSDSQCQSNLCDDDNIGWSDDDWCFSVENTYYDNQDSKCEESARSANDDWCDEKRNENLNTCDKTGEPYFQDSCSDICAISDTNICRSSAFASGCTADPECNGIEAGTGGCSLTCQNDGPTNSTIIYPNGGETVSGYAIINWTQSFDPEGYSTRYFLDYSNDSGTTWFNIISDYGYENKLNDSSTKKTITFGGNENKTVYLRIPKNAIITSAILDLEGIV